MGSERRENERGATASGRGLSRGKVESVKRQERRHYAALAGSDNTR